MHFSAPTATALSILSLIVPSVTAHGYIKEWSADNGQYQPAQKTSLSSSAFRSVPDNTGWVGSKFLTTKASVCSASNTPFGTVAAPSGTFFSDSGSAAGQELSVQKGGKVNLVVAGDAGVGWPHQPGHIATYMALCGDGSQGACTKFDASQGKWFKIQEEKNGVQTTLKPAYSSSLDGNAYTVNIPALVPSGSYMFRFELLVFDQSSSAEGGQDQYYPFCGQVRIEGEDTGTSAALAKFDLVTFPGVYQDGNIDQNTTPGPSVLALSAGGTATTGGNSTTTDSGSSSSSSSSSGSGTSSSSSAGSTGSCKRKNGKRGMKRVHRQHRRHHAQNAYLAESDFDLLSA